MGAPAGQLQLGPATMMAMTTAWALTYVLTRLLLPDRSKDFCNRCVSMIHVVVSAFFCYNSVADWSRPLAGVGAASTYLQMLALTVSLAYFIYDTICCAVELPFSWEMLMHHALTILGLAFGYLRQVSGTELVACLMLMEVSNPYMHGRELLKELKLKDSPLSLANDVAFALVFTVARMFIGPVVTYKCLISPTSPLPVKVGAVGIQVVSLLWFYKIARMVVYKLSKPKAKKSSLPIGMLHGVKVGSFYEYPRAFRCFSTTCSTFEGSKQMLMRSTLVPGECAVILHRHKKAGIGRDRVQAVRNAVAKNRSTTDNDHTFGSS